MIEVYHNLSVYPWLEGTFYNDIPRSLEAEILES